MEAGVARLFRALQKVELSLSNENGKFALFGMLMRDQASKWDVVVAASWLPSSRRQSLVQLFDPLKAAVGASGLMMVSRMLVLEPCNHFVVAVRAAAGQVEHGFQKIDGGDYGAVELSVGYVITSEPVRRLRPLRIAT